MSYIRSTTHFRTFDECAAVHVEQGPGDHVRPGAVWLFLSGPDEPAGLLASLQLTMPESTARAMLDALSAWAATRDRASTTTAAA